MQIPVVLILFAIANVVYVPSTQYNIHKKYVFDVNTINNVDRTDFVSQNITPVESVPWRAENDILDALERFSVARRKRGVALVGPAVKKARDAVKAAQQGEKAVEKVLENTKPSEIQQVKSKKRVTFEHKALNVKDPFKDANERFDSVKPTDVKALPGDKIEGRTGTVGDRTITVRDRSTSGEKSPTVEIFKSDEKPKIVHKVRHEEPVEAPKPLGGEKSEGGWWGGESNGGLGRLVEKKTFHLLKEYLIILNKKLYGRSRG